MPVLLVSSQMVQGNLVSYTNARLQVGSWRSTLSSGHTTIRTSLTSAKPSLVVGRQCLVSSMSSFDQPEALLVTSFTSTPNLFGARSSGCAFSVSLWVSFSLPLACRTLITSPLCSVLSQASRFSWMHRTELALLLCRTFFLRRTVCFQSHFRINGVLLIRRGCLFRCTLWPRRGHWKLGRGRICCRLSAFWEGLPHVSVDSRCH